MEKQYNIAGINLTDEEVFSLKEAFDNVEWVFFSNGFQFHKWMEGHGLPINMVITRGTFNSPNGYPLTQQLRKSSLFKAESAIILIVDEITDAMREKAIRHGITELFDAETSTSDALFRVKYLLENPVTKKVKSNEPVLEPYSIPWDKRLFDLFFAGMALLFLSPLFLLVGIAIRLESKGPIFYYSLRVTGYKVFRFYKFRSKFTGADAKLKDLAHFDRYKEEAEKKKEQEEEVVTEGFYGSNIKRYFDLFPKEQIKVFLHDDLRNDSEKVMRELFDFIGVDSDFKADLEREYNVSGKPKNKLMDTLIGSNSVLIKSVKAIAPGLIDALKEGAAQKVLTNLRKKNMERPDVDKAFKHKLFNEVYAQKVNLLEEVIGRDLTHWKNKYA